MRRERRDKDRGTSMIKMEVTDKCKDTGDRSDTDIKDRRDEDERREA
jgi:hypothetical protein